MTRADFVEFFGDGLLGQLGTIAVLAEMGEEDVTKFVGSYFAGESGGGVIAEVAVTGHDALFQGPRAGGIFLQQFQIVIGFHHQDVHGTHAFGNEFGGVPEIGEHADGDTRCGVADDVPDRVVGIVRDAEGFHQ